MFISMPMSMSLPTCTVMPVSILYVFVCIHNATCACLCLTHGLFPVNPNTCIKIVFVIFMTAYAFVYLFNAYSRYMYM